MPHAGDISCIIEAKLDKGTTMSGFLSSLRLPALLAGAMAFGAAWNACGKPGSWRNADRQWKAT